jgi:hypothetical protein
MRIGALPFQSGFAPGGLAAHQPQAHFTHAFYAAPVVRLGAWNDLPGDGSLGLRRYGEPPMVNPIEPGVAADPQRPGTGVDLTPLRALTYDQRWDPKIYDVLRQDVLLSNEGNHPTTGHNSGLALYGRRIVMRSIERTAGSKVGTPKTVFFPSPLNGRVHVEGVIVDHTLGGAGDMFMTQQGPHLWDTKITDWNNYLPGSLIITPSLRLYVILAKGAGPSVEPTNETGLSFTAGTATIAFVKKYADKAAFEAEFPRQNHTWQRVYTKGRHGSYYPFYAGAAGAGGGEDFIKATVPVIKIVRSALGLVTLTTGTPHGVVAGTHPLINVCDVPYEMVNNVPRRSVGGLWTPTVVDAVTITYQTTIEREAVWNAPANEPYTLQAFTQAGTGSAVVSGKTVTVTTNANHGLTAAGAAGLKWVKLFGASLPVAVDGDDLVVTAITANTITATIPNNYNVPDGTYNNLVVIGTGLFSGADYYFSEHADFRQCEVSSRVGVYRSYQNTDTHFSYDVDLFGTRYPLETMVKGAEFARCNWRRRKEKIPYDSGNSTFILNEADEANFGRRLFEVLLSEQGPRGLTDVSLGRECTVELDRDEDGSNVCNPSPGRHINGVDAGALFRVEFGQRYVYYPPNAMIAGRMYLTPCQDGDTTQRDVLKRSQVGAGYVKGPLADAPPLVAPPAPCFRLLAPSFPENTLADVDLGWVDAVPDPTAFLELTPGLFAWKGNSHGLTDSIVDITFAGSSDGRISPDGRVLMSGARLRRHGRLDYSAAVDLGNGQKGFRYSVVAKNRADRTLQTFGEIVIPITAATPLPASALTLDPAANNAANTLSEGNLRVTTSNAAPSNRLTKATAGIGTNRKVYWEVKILGVYVGSGRAAIGLTTAAAGLSSSPGAIDGQFIIQYNGAVTINRQTTGVPAGPNWSGTGSVLRFAYDSGAKRIWIGLNGDWASGEGDGGSLAAGRPTGGNPETGLGGWSLSAVGDQALPTAVLRALGDDFRFAFDGGGWAYLPPNGFTAI